MQSSEKVLQFAPFRSFVDSSFFQVLSDKKLTDFKLDTSERPISALYSIPVSSAANSSGIITLSGSGFDSVTPGPNECLAPGLIRNLNTSEEFKSLDKSVLIQEQGEKLWSSILNGEVAANPSLLSSFYLLCFSDLKKYKFYYWFAFPALHSDWSFADDESTPITSAFVKTLDSWRSSVPDPQNGFFLIKEGVPDSGPTFGTLGEWEDFFGGYTTDDEITVGFADPSSFPQSPGWPLRNFLTYIASKGCKRVKVFCYRDLPSLSSQTRSIWMSFEYRGEFNKAETPRVSGWERSVQNKLVPKSADLSSLLNPLRLADQAVDLNLQLMRWRIAPTLDIDKVKNSKCLLLGAGTLGSYVARSLMGWGVRKISFVDNSTVSYSNPVRQALYTFEDSQNNAPKASTAASALQQIYPGVDSSGYNLSVPMAGHPITNEEKQNAEYTKLVELISSHDAVFLLMDSREARWLPSVIGAALGKIVINAALGFDSYVVMRHGVPSSTNRLGCYFCNDIFAPSDSLTDRTLDQMCTVTRPGIALIAAGLATELFVSIVQHPLGPAAPTSQSTETNDATAVPADDDFDHPLGEIPHQIRGFLRRFQQMNIMGVNYEHCSACSEPIVNLWKSEGWEFVKKALNVRGYVDEVSGLAEVRKRADELVNDDDWGIDDDSEEDM
ncbi:hypothetical protein BZA70DRAFT_283857 [Myxozyma melibiosi]|uniref:Ubiquitin-like modifier-activating enzyme ATG7 n=1 Tax=Myxozyma melibiosi TaxID=54550 RepID=A0ABR1EZR5_9ASCO